jgi:hypothetical protein
MRISYKTIVLYLYINNIYVLQYNIKVNILNLPLKNASQEVDRFFLKLIYQFN